MNNRIFKRFILFSCITPFLFCSCQSEKRVQTPPPEEEQVYPVLPIPTPRELPEEPTTNQPQTPTTNDIWDLSEVDISYIDRSRKLLSFTFDDAPSKHFENILAVFSAYNETHEDCQATATFFCNGHFFNETTIHSLRLASALNIELGNHTFSHPNLPLLSTVEIQAEIDRTDELLQKIDGKPRHLFRAPFGRIDERVKQAVQTPIIDWTIDTLDWTGVSEQSIYDTVFTQKFAGAIVLMHDGYENTVQALKRLLPDLYDAGYQVVSVSAMAKAHDCPLRRGGVYIRARSLKQ